MLLVYLLTTHGASRLQIMLPVQDFASVDFPASWLTSWPPEILFFD